jgi:hypothetical protein
MRMRIAILAALACTFALAQANPTRAAYAGAAESKSLVRITDVGPKPMIVLAFKISDNESPRPVDRKSARKGTGKTKAKGRAVPTDSRDVTKARGTIYRDESTGQAGFSLRKGNQPGNTGSNVSIGGFTTGGATQRK